MNMDPSSENKDKVMEVPENPSELLVGDLLWSRVPGYPFWPCMISYDPLQGIFSKTKNFKTKFVSYHVQYFGEQAHHGWTTPNNVMAFEGLKKFEDFVASVKERAKANSQSRQKFLSKYLVAPAQKTKWDSGVSDAEMALDMSRTERIESFTFIYTMPKKKKMHDKDDPVKEKKGKIKDTASNSESEDATSADLPKKKDPVINGPHPEQLCQICEKASPDMTCSGLCSQSFHSSCLGVLVSTEKFVCGECISGKHTCFSCKSSVGITKKCTVNKCDKFYHIDCFQKFPMTDVGKFICPLHFCLTCHNEKQRNTSVFRSRLVKCFRCPIAYHSREYCIAAGSQHLSQMRILCPEHFVADKKRSYQSVHNIDWCFICNQVGSLVCCESCPAAFHASCLDIEPPEGKYFCEECISKKHVTFGTVVWVKIGNYRWWPAQAKNSKDIPPNILKMKHNVGEFCIQYFGTHEYYWTHRGRIFPYCEDDFLSSDQGIRLNGSKSAIQAKYNISLVEAATAYGDWSKQKNESSHEKLPAYKHAKVNKPVGNVQIFTIDIKSHVKCNCEPGKDACGFLTDCLNSTMLVECNPIICPAGETCTNQLFQKRQYAQTVPFWTGEKGYALKTLEDLKSGQFVIEYVGDLIDPDECKRRLALKHDEDDNNFYFLTLDKNRIIDAGPRGNFSRFMNHSCAPNCETQKWIVNGDVRIGLFTKQDVPAGTELTFDYLLDTLDNEKLKCRCGEQTCRGAIGEKAAKAAIKDGQETKDRGKKQKRKSATKLKKEECCYHCKETGNLKMCCRKGCPKGYHLSCLEGDEIVLGRWQCPWHFCDVCGKLSKYLCSLCSNSFCEKHKTNSQVSSFENYVCPDHEDENVEEKLHYDSESIDIKVPRLQNGDVKPMNGEGCQ